MINVKNLSKYFDDRMVFENINLNVSKGQRIVIVGKSGSGKSTFLRCLNLMETPDSGEIYLDGKNILEKDCDINKTRQKLGMVFQHFNLFPHLTIRENITLAPVNLKLMTKENADKKADELLKKIGLLDKADFYPSTLSGGQKQRIAIIRALAMNPEVMLFDEPTSALDPTMVKEVLSLIKEIALGGTTMIIVTHEMKFAREVATKMLFMDNGKIAEENTPDQFFENPQTDALKDFLSCMN